MYRELYILSSPLFPLVTQRPETFFHRQSASFAASPSSPEQGGGGGNKECRRSTAGAANPPSGRGCAGARAVFGRAVLGVARCRACRSRGDGVRAGSALGALLGSRVPCPDAGAIGEDTRVALVWFAAGVEVHGEQVAEACSEIETVEPS